MKSVSEVSAGVPDKIRTKTRVQTSSVSTGSTWSAPIVVAFEVIAAVSGRMISERRIGKGLERRDRGIIDGICWEALRKTTKNLGQDDGSHD